MAGVTTVGRHRGEGPVAVVGHPMSRGGLNGDSQDSSYLADLGASPTQLTAGGRMRARAEELGEELRPPPAPSPHELKGRERERWTWSTTD
jgi:hypothetical protein